MKLIIYFVFFSLLLVFSSCSYFKETEVNSSIARVNDYFLYEEDLKGLVTNETTKEDSVLIVKDFINRWATQRLLKEAAERNLSEEQKMEFEKLIEQYRYDIYTRAYLEAIVNETIDTTLSIEEMRNYYDLHKQNFNTLNQIVKLKYINLPEDHPKFKNIEQNFFDEKTKPSYWKEYELQFKNFAMNDSIWVDVNQIYKKLPFINPDNRENYIVQGKQIKYRDSLDFYLVKIKSVIDQNKEAPFEYILPTIKQIILNQRKLDLIKKFQQDIANDALKNKNYEIYQ